MKRETKNGMTFKQYADSLQAVVDQLRHYSKPLTLDKEVEAGFSDTVLTPLEMTFDELQALWQAWKGTKRYQGFKDCGRAAVLILGVILSLGLSACEHKNRAVASVDEKTYCAEHPTECAMSASEVK